jgi:hypothetical protein
VCLKRRPPVIEYDFKCRKKLFDILGAGFIARLTIPDKTTSSVDRKAFILVIVDWAKAGIEQKEAIGWVRSSTTLAEAEKWRQVGLTFSEVVRLKLEGFEMEDVLKWNSSELPSEQVNLPQQELGASLGFKLKAA